MRLMTDERKPQDLWNGPSGQVWAEEQELLDRMLEPYLPHVLEGLPPGADVLDVGCGAGATTIAAAARAASCTGVDVSAQLVARARERAAGLGNVRFVRADAQRYDFEEARFDALLSRFGVMFFDDPVAAFANLRRAMRPGGTLTFIAWRSPAENPFFTTASRAAAPFLNLSPPDPEAPGQFAFADGERVRRILDGSGWSAIEVAPRDVAGSLSKADLRVYASKLGPVGQALREVDDATRAQVLEAVHAAYAPFLADGTVRFTSACWRVTARA